MTEVSDTTKLDHRIAGIESTLKDILEKVSQQQLPAEIIDTKELCKRLQVTEPTIITWRSRGKIPSLKIGAAVRFDWNKVLSALEVKTKGVRYA